MDDETGLQLQAGFRGVTNQPMSDPDSTPASPELPSMPEVEAVVHEHLPEEPQPAVSPPLKPQSQPEETTGTGTIVAIGCVALVIVVTLVAIIILTIVS
jgi:hypothetical protein